MTDAAADTGDQACVLASILDLTAAEPLHRQLLAAARSGRPVLLDGTAVERVSTAVVQVLLAAASEAHGRGVSFDLRTPSPELKSALIDLGVASQLGL